MKPLPLRYIAGILFLIVFVLAGTAAREDLILSLEDVIGQPPTKSDLQQSKDQKVFYSLQKADLDPEIEQLIQRRQMGIVLTLEEQELLSEYEMGGRVAGGNSLIRRIYPPVLNWQESSIKVASGKRYSFINCVPNADGPFPVALVLDPEIQAQFDAGMEEYYRVVRRMPIEAEETPFTEAFRGRYITSNPIGNQLISHGISVIIPIGETLEQLDTLSGNDWQSVLKYFMKKSTLDSDSLFVIATKEFASQAIQVASSYPITGLMLEEPETGLFGTTLPGNMEDSMKIATLLNIYKDNLSELSAPTLLIRNKQNKIINLNDSLLLTPLINANRRLHLRLTEYPLRTLETDDDVENESEKNGSWNSRFAYNFETMEKVAKAMLYFVQSNGKSGLYLLPERSVEPRSVDRTVSNLNLWGQMNQRFNERLNPDDQSTQTTDRAPVLSTP